MLEGPGARSPLVGRGDDLARLTAACGLSDVGELPATGGGLVVLSGDAGIGKTRLLTELSRFAREGGRDILLGHCLGEGGRDLPYLPFTEVLGRLFDADPGRVADLVAAYPALRRLVPRHGLAGPEPSESRADERGDGHVPGPVGRADLVEAVHGGLEHLARARPLLVVVEDVHWADPSTQELLTVLFTRGFTGPVALVVSYRTDDLHRRHPLQPTLAHWARLGHVTRIELGPLSDADMRVLVRGLGAPGGPALERVVARAEGNAFFAEELAAAGDLPFALPTGDLGRLLLLRVENLDDEAVRVVRLACVAGRAVGHALLSAVAGVSEADLDAALRAAVERGILVPAGSVEAPAYAFRHALLAECLYDDLLPGERTRAHATFVAALSADPALGSAATLARHAAAVGDRETAIDASLRAGAEALSMGGPEEALAHAERALSALTRDDPRTHVAALAAATAATAAGRALRAVDLLAERLSDLGGLDAPCPPAAAAERAELLAEYAATSRLTDVDVDRLPITARALELLTADADPALLGRVRIARAQALYDAGIRDEADTLVAEVIAAAGAAGHPRIAAEAMTIRARYVDVHGFAADVASDFEKVIAAGDADPSTTKRAYHHLGAHHLRLGDFAAATDAFRRGSDVAAAVGRPWAPYALECLGLAAVAAYEQGEWDAALAAVADTAGAPEPGRSFLAAAGLGVAVARGDAEAFAELPAIRRWWPHEGQVVVTSAAPAIEWLALKGDLPGAIDVHRQAVADLDRLWGPQLQAGIRLGATLVGRLVDAVAEADAQTRSRWVSHAGTILATCDDIVNRMNCLGEGGPESHAWAARLRAETLLLRSRGSDGPHHRGAGTGGADPEALIGAWREAVAAFTAYPNVYELARSRARLAAALHLDPARRETRRDEAIALLAEAGVVADRLGACHLRRELDGVAAGWGSLPAGPGGGRERPRGSTGDGPAGAGDLTRRELEVIRLLARGRTNGQVGQELFISTKTASVHVSNILAKLGVATRGEAAAYAHREGLLGDPADGPRRPAEPLDGRI